MAFFRTSQSRVPFGPPISASVTSVVPVPTIPKPSPIATEGMAPDHWKVMAKKVGFTPQFLNQEEFRLGLRELGIPIYDLDEVSQYMNAAVVRLNTTEKDSAPTNWSGTVKEWRWQWTPLREADVSEGNMKWSHYQHAVPLHALEKVALIMEKFPEAKFHVSEITQRPKGDPFLAVQYKSWEMVVIDQWDEPGFTGRAS